MRGGVRVCGIATMWVAGGSAGGRSLSWRGADRVRSYPASSLQFLVDAGDGGAGGAAWRAR